MEGVATKILGRASLIDREKLSRPIGPRERGPLFNEEKLRDSTEDCGIDENQNEVTLVPEMAREAPLLLAQKYSLLRI